MRFAVCDGATESIYAKRWARLLARAWVSPSSWNVDPEDLAGRVCDVGDRLSDAVAVQALPWYLAEKSQIGAFAAFLGVSLDAESGWEAIALGDCCLFVEREHELDRSFPVERADQFSSRPILVPSNHARFPDFSLSALRTRGTWAPGWRLTLMSDASAAWYLGRWEAADTSSLAQFHDALEDSDPGAFARFIEAARAARIMRNDDVAVIRLEWAET